MKNITVAKGLNGRKWTKGMQQIWNTEEINQFVDMWNRVLQT
jgi:hypothetical protein